MENLHTKNQPPILNTSQEIQVSPETIQTDGQIVASLYTEGKVRNDIIDEGENEIIFTCYTVFFFLFCLQRHYCCEDTL